jgi:N-succinyl-L-ornithine transcarbamylase
MKETKGTDGKKKKVVLTWAPHPKALPHAVANSFVQMMQRQDVEFVITHPPGYELDERVTGSSRIEYDQEKAFKGADFIYAKNWSSYRDYGKVLSQDETWMIDSAKMELTDGGKFMHCLPVRRNVVVSDAVLDSEASLVIEQANNRTYAVQLVLQKILKRLGNER